MGGGCVKAQGAAIPSPEPPPRCCSGAGSVAAPPVLPVNVPPFPPAPSPQVAPPGWRQQEGVGSTSGWLWAEGGPGWWPGWPAPVPREGWRERPGGLRSWGAPRSRAARAGPGQSSAEPGGPGAAARSPAEISLVPGRGPAPGGLPRGPCEQRGERGIWVSGGVNRLLAGEPRPAGSSAAAGAAKAALLEPAVLEPAAPGAPGCGAGLSPAGAAPPHK